MNAVFPGQLMAFENNGSLVEWTLISSAIRTVRVFCVSDRPATLSTAWSSLGSRENATSSLNTKMRVHSTNKF